MVDQGGDLQNRAGREKRGRAMFYSFERSEATDCTPAGNMAAVAGSCYLQISCSVPGKLSTNIH